MYDYNFFRTVGGGLFLSAFEDKRRCLLSVAGSDLIWALQLHDYFRVVDHSVGKYKERFMSILISKWSLHLYGQSCVACRSAWKYNDCSCVGMFVGSNYPYISVLNDTWNAWWAYCRTELFTCVYSICQSRRNPNMIYSLVIYYVRTLVPPAFVLEPGCYCSWICSARLLFPLGR